MSQSLPEGYGRITPYLLYKDSDAAVDFLTRAFGFTERYRMTDSDGKTNHAEVDHGGSVVMLGTQGEEAAEPFQNPNELGGRTQLIYVYVDDVDAHFQQAKAAGAEIVTEPEDQFYGDRSYRVRDPEGHAWSFATHVRDVSPEEMQAAAQGS